MLSSVPLAAAAPLCARGQAGHIPTAEFVDWTADIVRDPPGSDAPSDTPADDFVPVHPTSVLLVSHACC